MCTASYRVSRFTSYAVNSPVQNWETVFIKQIFILVYRETGHIMTIGALIPRQGDSSQLHT